MTKSWDIYSGGMCWGRSETDREFRYARQRERKGKSDKGTITGWQGVNSLLFDHLSVSIIKTVSSHRKLFNMGFAKSESSVSKYLLPSCVNRRVPSKRNFKHRFVKISFFASAGFLVSRGNQLSKSAAISLNL
jgi:hypothetical protein